MRRLAGPALAIALGGCAVTPNVAYHNLGTEKAQDNWAPFRLTDSTVVLGAPATAPAFSDDKPGERFAAPISLQPTDLECFAPGCGGVAGVAAPIGFAGEVLAIEPLSRRLVSTKLSPVYVPNSLRLKVLTIEAKDHRLEAINTLGALARGAVELASGDRSNEDPTAPKPLARLHLPVTIDLADARCLDRTADCTPAVLKDPATPVAGAAPRALPENAGWTYSFEFLDNPRRAGFLPRAQVGTVHGAAVSSVCRTLRVRLDWTAGGVAPVILQISVADPDWLATVPFPAKGAVVFHPLCGADVQPQPVTEVGVDTLANAFFNNVAAVRAAQHQ